MYNEIKKGEKFYCHTEFENDAKTTIFHAEKTYSVIENGILIDELNQEATFWCGEYPDEENMKLLEQFKSHFINENDTNQKSQ